MSPGDGHQANDNMEEEEAHSSEDLAQLSPVKLDAGHVDTRTSIIMFKVQSVRKRRSILGSVCLEKSAVCERE